MNNHIEKRGLFGDILRIINLGQLIHAAMGFMMFCLPKEANGLKAEPRVPFAPDLPTASG